MSPFFSFQFFFFWYWVWPLNTCKYEVTYVVNDPNLPRKWYLKEDSRTWKSSFRKHLVRINFLRSLEGFFFQGWKRVSWQACHVWSASLTTIQWPSTASCLATGSRGNASFSLCLKAPTLVSLSSSWRWQTPIGFYFPRQPNEEEKFLSYSDFTSYCLGQWRKLLRGAVGSLPSGYFIGSFRKVDVRPSLWTTVP